MIVFGTQYAPEIAKAAPAKFDPAKDRCLATMIDGEVAGGFLFCDYTGFGGSFMTHVAGWRRGWLNRTLLFNAANYAFNQCQCGRIFGQVPDTSPKVLAFDLKLGWKEECWLDGVYPTGGAHILSMAKEDCRWLKYRPRGA